MVFEQNGPYFEPKKRRNAFLPGQECQSVGVFLHDVAVELDKHVVVVVECGDGAD